MKEFLDFSKWLCAVYGFILAGLFIVSIFVSMSMDGPRCKIASRYFYVGGFAVEYPCLFVKWMSEVVR